MNARLKLAKIQANTKQHPKAELLLFENYSHPLSTLSSKTIGHTLKNEQWYKRVYFHFDYTINHNENDDENQK